MAHGLEIFRSYFEILTNIVTFNVFEAVPRCHVILPFTKINVVSRYLPQISPLIGEEFLFQVDPTLPSRMAATSGVNVRAVPKIPPGKPTIILIAKSLLTGASGAEIFYPGLWHLLRFLTPKNGSIEHKNVP